jgi:peptidoglycan hydrolase-like protein with peptidoglycan-binding domain
MPTHPLTSPTAPTPAPAPWVTRRVRLSITTLVCVLLALTGLSAPARADVTVTPGSFTGYGFDQCLTPSQSAMDAWLRSSPFWAVGIYISGKSRACRTQPNQTPAWVRTQLANGWRLLPITLGPQASCNPRFPRYSDDVRINPSSARSYRAARLQGRAEATSTVARAQELGIGKGSTLWYDMEAYDSGNTACRESALSFLSAWTNRLHQLDYVSGVYSSAGSGIADLDNARVNRPGRFAMPDRIWIARWDGVANTSTSYIRDDGWLPGGRMKQYRGGHNETWGGVTINIDSNWLDLGNGSKAPPPRSYCGGVRLSFRTYPVLREGATGDRVSALQCLLQTRAGYAGKITGTLDSATMDATVAWRTSHGMDSRRLVGAGTWTSLHADGITRIIKLGAAGERVRRLQRALNATGAERLPVTGVFAAGTTAAVKRYQKGHGLTQSGVVTPAMWTKLATGKY